MLSLFDVKHLPVFPSHVPVLSWEYCSTLAGKLQYSHGGTGREGAKGFICSREVTKQDDKKVATLVCDSPLTALGLLL